MPLRSLTRRERSPLADRELAALLAFTAGTVDVCGFLMLGRFTSHVTGLVATMAARMAEDSLRMAIVPLAVLGAFLLGAATSAVTINWLRRRRRESEYAIPVLLEAVMLATIALAGSQQRPTLTLAMMAFTMGLQNAIITKISNKEIRTTHITAMVTDIGIHLGKALYWNRSREHEPVRADRPHLLLLCVLVTLFFSGGLLAAFAYPHIGLRLLLPFAAVLAILTVHPISVDLRRAQR